MRARKLEIFIIVAAIAAIGLVYAFTQKPVSAPTNQDANNVQTQQKNSSITYQGVEGKTALELLKASHQVETKSYSFGDMVVAIDGVSPDQTKAFWSFYVNGSQAQVGAGSYVTKSGDVIEWKLEFIK
ncbi:MAG: DUF4430 domain-containing protein [Candidatus Doudnabacteria bacterium]|nr:DUF4430 domain-containing protein [Candidatus Doudnabacteria bacterium]